MPHPPARYVPRLLCFPLRLVYFVYLLYFPYLRFSVPSSKFRTLQLLCLPLLRELPGVYPKFPFWNSSPAAHPPLFSRTYVGLILQTLCFQIHACNGGVYESVWRLQVVATNCARPTTLSKYVVVATNKNRVPTQTRVPPHLTLPLPRRSFITIHFPLPTIPLSFRETFLPPLSYLSPRTGPSAGQEASSHVRP